MDPWSKPAPKKTSNATEQANHNVARLREFNKHMKNLAQYFGTEDDTQGLRDRMHEGRRQANALIRETTNLLKVQAVGQSKVAQDKAKKDLQAAVNEFKALAEEHKRTERELLVQLEEQYAQSYGHAPQYQGEYEEPQFDEEEFEQRTRTRTKLQLDLCDGMDDADLKIIEERNYEVQRLDHELDEVVDLFREVNDMTDVQGERLEMADETTVKSQEKVKETEEELGRFYRCCGGLCCCVYRRKY